MNLILRDIRKILRHPYNRQKPVNACLRYGRYLWLKLKKKDAVLRVWNNRSVYYFADSVQSTWLIFNYIIDWEEFNLIKHTLKDNSVFLDIGSNIGYYSIWASKFIKTGKIFSFEPNQKSFERLLKNISLNKLEGIICSYQKAVSSSRGTVTMTNDQDTLNHLVLDSTNTKNKTEVGSVTIDEICREENIDFIDYLKVDVEGFELQVLLGATELLKARKIGIIQLEINNALQNSGCSIKEIVSFIEEIGYSLSRYDVWQKKLTPTSFHPNRENYFIIPQ